MALPNATNEVWRKGQIVFTAVGRTAPLREVVLRRFAGADRISIAGTVRDGGHTPLRARA